MALFALERNHLHPRYAPAQANDGSTQPMLNSHARRLRHPRGIAGNYHLEATLAIQQTHSDFQHQRLFRQHFATTRTLHSSTIHEAYAQTSVVHSAQCATNC